MHWSRPAAVLALAVVLALVAGGLAALVWTLASELRPAVVGGVALVGAVVAGLVWLGRRGAANDATVYW